MKLRKILSLVLVLVMALSSVASAAVYTVQDGDVLWRIAQNHGTTWQALAEINELANPNLIYVGQELITEGYIPTPEVPKTGIEEGTYLATAKGFAGDVDVEVTIIGGEIAAVEVVAHSETAGIGTMAIEQLPAKIVATNSVDVDTVAGATVTSNAILAAVEAVLTTPVESTGLNGTYEATATGRKSIIKVEVTFEDSMITDVVILEEKESEIYSDVALERIPAEIVEYQSTAIDVVAGATITSNAIIRAVDSAIVAAGGNVADYSDAVEVAVVTEEIIDVDVAIMGGGAAGLMAGITAAEEGKDVIIVEKLAFAGGNLLSAVGVIAGPGSKLQEEYGVEMTPQSYLEGKIATREALPHTPYYTDNPQFTQLFYEQNQITCNWIIDRGIEFVEPPMGVSHTLAPGYYLGVANFTNFLVDTFVEAGGTIIYETEGTELIFEDNAVKGFYAESESTDYTINATSTLVATGGFTSSKELIGEYFPDFVDIYSTAMVSNTGDGFNMITEVGGVTEALGAGVHKIPVTSVSKIDIPFFAIMSGAVLVNNDGERFTSESSNPPANTEKMLLQEGSTGYYILDESDKQALMATFESIFVLGDALEYSSIEEMAADLDMPELEATITRYNEMAENGKDEDFGRSFNFHALTGDTFYAVPIEAGLYLTYGGIKVDLGMRVVDANDNPIEGLYAAGDIIGSVEAKEGFGYTAGVTHALSFGRVAAESMMEDAE